MLPDYGRAVTSMRQRSQAAEQLEQLRDALFALQAWTTPPSLADWLGDESSFGCCEPVLTPGASWVLALTSRNDNGGRQFLQRFWQSRSLAGGDLDITRYRGLGVISSRGQQSQGRPSTTSPQAEHPPLASALINDQLVLLASSRGQLEDALDASQEEARNLAGDALLECTGWIQEPGDWLWCAEIARALPTAGAASELRQISPSSNLSAACNSMALGFAWLHS